MSSVAHAPAVRDARWTPLSPKAFFLIVFVLSVGLVGLDIALIGPLTYTATTMLVVEPVERDWGFHAEWMVYGPDDRRTWLLTVVAVTENGPFGRAGVRPGFALAPSRCAFGGSQFAALHSALSATSEVKLRMLPRPGESWEERTIEISRNRAVQPPR